MSLEFFRQMLEVCIYLFAEIQCSYITVNVHDMHVRYSRILQHFWNPSLFSSGNQRSKWKTLDRIIDVEVKKHRDVISFVLKSCIPAACSNITALISLKNKLSQL